MVDRNAEVAADKRIEFRIGIHLGDVVEESDGDLMGDGVNIAARLQGVAKPGTICLSEQAYWQVKGRLDLAVTDLGKTPLKNIAEPASPAPACRLRPNRHGPLDDAAVMHGDDRVDQVAAQRPEPRQNSVLVGSGQPRIADHVGHLAG